MQLRFVASASALDYFRATQAYLEEHGKPVAFYSDKHAGNQSIRFKTMNAGHKPCAFERNIEQSIGEAGYQRAFVMIDRPFTAPCH